MIWVIGIIKFICSAVAIFCTCAFILTCITSVINPDFSVIEEDGKKVVYDRYDNIRYTLSIIMSIAWGVVIAL